VTALRPAVVSQAGPEIVDRVNAAGAADMTEVARLAAGRYGISPGCRLHLYPLTENWTFRIEADAAAPGVLRIYRPGGRSPAEIHSELAWMEALRQESPTLLPGVIPTLQGGQVLEVVREPPLERCYCVLFSHAPGSEPAEDQLAAWFPRLGEITGRLHRHARAWTVPSWFRRPRWDLDTTLGGRPHWGSWQSTVTDPEERRQTQRLADAVMARLRAFGTGPRRFGLVHADLRLANLLVDGERITVIDFEDCGFSWYLYDLACALTFNEGRADVRELIALWVDGYRQVEPLSAADEAEIDTFLMLRRLMLSAYAGLRHDTELAAQMKADGYSAETCRIAEPYLSRFG
jgi:Ser/Thr protein kinase RdoA (MazF antagonist)